MHFIFSPTVFFVILSFLKMHYITTRDTTQLKWVRKFWCFSHLYLTPFTQAKRDLDNSQRELSKMEQDMDSHKQIVADLQQTNELLVEKVDLCEKVSVTFDFMTTSQSAHKNMEASKTWASCFNWKSTSNKKWSYCACFDLTKKWNFAFKSFFSFCIKLKT